MPELDEVFKGLPRLPIGGEAVDSASDRNIDVINPSNGRRIAEIPAGSTLDVDLAVRTARSAFEAGSWSGAPAAMRKEVLLRLASSIRKEASRLDLIDATEMGKPISTARFNALAAADHFAFHAEAADKVTGHVLPTDGQSFQSLRLVPRGIVGAITPWNFPTYNAVMKLAPALAAGNCVVLKPSELSSFSALRIAELAAEAGVPPGALNVVLGDGRTVGKALALHTDVDMITFTGSTEVGKLIMQYAGQSNMKSVLLECGGKCPQIVFDDGVDLDAAADFIALYLLTNQGQVCSSGTRLLVQRSVEEAMLDRLVERFSDVQIGDAILPTTDFGPLASAAQCKKVLAHIEQGKKCAELVTGGKPVLNEGGGNFVLPTIFRAVPPDATIAQEEIFGPVLSVTAFDTVDEAIRLANGTKFGLNAYAWTASTATAHRLAQAIRSAVSVRSGKSQGRGPGHAGSNEPFGNSGIGIEGGLAGLKSYLRHHSVGFYY